MLYSRQENREADGDPGSQPGLVQYGSDLMEVTGMILSNKTVLKDLVWREETAAAIQLQGQWYIPRVRF